ncbi:MAG: hypothetical protein ACI81R_001808 [Bradymonadia bacterium]|jgi:uncharacterized protein
MKTPPNHTDQGMRKLRQLVEARLRRTAAGLAWDFEHAARVATNALRLGPAHAADTGESVNLTVLEAAALLHEVGRGAQRPGETVADASARIAEEMLRATGLSEIVWAACEAILCHIDPKRLPDTPESKVLCDADLLEDVGAIGVARTFLVASANYVPTLYDAVDPAAERRAIEPNAYMLDMIPHQRQSALDRAATNVGSREITRRSKVNTQFRDALLREVVGRLGTEEHRRLGPRSE